MKKFLILMSLVATFGSAAFAGQVSSDNTMVYCAKAGKFVRSVAKTEIKPVRTQPVKSNKAS